MNTPILFLIFNRPDTTKQVFETIRKYQPKQLFIAADGPREEKKGEKELCEQVRKITSDIDWDCEVKTLFRNKNLGCGKAVSEAITWFFENVEEGIILEDDCLPNQSFFSFCEKMLENYRNDYRIMMISGTNRLDKKEIENDYFFSQHFQIWGWATWKRAWILYDNKMENWFSYKEKKVLNYVFGNKEISSYYSKMFDAGFLKIVDTWDIQWNYSCIFNHGLSISPKYNFIKNIGKAGTHTKKEGLKDPSLFRETKDLIIDYKKNMAVFPNYELDIIQFKNFHKKYFLKEFYSKLIILKCKYIKC